MNLVRNALTMATGAAAAQGIALLATVVLARYYSPQDLGLQAFFMAWAGPIAVLATLRLDLAVVLPENEEEARDVASFALAVMSGVVVAVLAVTLSASRPLAALLGRGSENHAWLWLLAPTIGCLATAAIGYAFASRERRYSAIAASNALNQATYLAAGLLFASIGMMELGLVFAKVCGVVVAVWIVVRHGVKIDLPELARRWRRLNFARVLRTYRQFVIFNAPYSAFGLVARETPILALTAVGYLGAAGQYALARALVLAPSALAGSSLSQVFYREAATMAGTARLEAMFRRLLSLGAFSTAPLFGFAAVWCDFAFPAIFGAKWADAGLYAAMLAFPAWLAIQTSWPERLYEVNRRQDVSFRIQVFSDAATAAAIGAALLLGREPTVAVAVFAACNALYHCAYLAGICKASRFDGKWVAMTLLAATGCFAIAAAASMLARIAIGESWAALLAAAGGALALSGAVSTRFALRLVNETRAGVQETS